MLGKCSASELHPLSWTHLFLFGFISQHPLGKVCVLRSCGNLNIWTGSHGCTRVCARILYTCVARYMPLWVYQHACAFAPPCSGLMVYNSACMSMEGASYFGLVGRQYPELPRNSLSNASHIEVSWFILETVEYFFFFFKIISIVFSNPKCLKRLS
jgi:hypothetical protein